MRNPWLLYYPQALHLILRATFSYGIGGVYGKGRKKGRLGSGARLADLIYLLEGIGLIY